MCYNICDAAQAPYRPFVLMYNLLSCGEMNDCSIDTSIEKFKAVKAPPKSESQIDMKISNITFLFKKLAEHGFVFEGLKNDKPADKDIIISYPDDALLLHLWKMLADKAKNINSVIDFLQCSFRLLQYVMRQRLQRF